MGTNFYLCHVPTVKEHKEMQKLFIEKQYKALQDKLCKVMHIYHIGKRSWRVFV